MRVESISLRDFRNYQMLELDFPPDGLILVEGINGQGKTNLLEAVCFAARGRSFREPDTDILVRTAASSAVVRSDMKRISRSLLVECEISIAGRNRTNVNRQSVRGGRSRQEAVAITAFSPDDLESVKAGPSVRRNFLDQLLFDANERSGVVHADFERALKQRNSLLHQAHGRLSPEVALTLDVWDERLASAGESVAVERRQMTGLLAERLQETYRSIASDPAAEVGIEMVSQWRSREEAGQLLQTLRECREVDVQRGVTTSGPQRDDVQLTLNGMPARTRASQGEQRSLAIALKLAGHEHLTEVLEAPPVLLLDDIFSELDPGRTARLLEVIPAGQAFLATASEPPATLRAAQIVRVSQGEATANVA